MSQKTILVTGGAGFLGRHLCKKLLENGDKVICMDSLVTGSEENIRDFVGNPNFQFVEGDVRDSFFFPLVNEIYHLACIASPDKYKERSIETLETCFIGTQNVLNFARTQNAKVLFTSTSEVYGDPLQHPQTEEYYGNVNCVGERSCYDEGKRVAETLIYEYRKNYGLDLKIVRLFNTYGPYMNLEDGRVITNFISQIKKGKELIIYGDGNQTRSFCFVEDMISGLMSMMKSSELGPINLGNPDCEISLNDLVHIFRDFCETNVLPNFNGTLEVKYIKGTENDPQKRKPDIFKAKERLEFYPKISLIEGLKQTFQYYF